MTDKDYQRIAELLRTQVMPDGIKLNLIRRLARSFENDNPKFSRKAFFKAAWGSELGDQVMYGTQQKDEVDRFLSFLGERISTATTDASKSAYIIVKSAFMNIFLGINWETKSEDSKDTNNPSGR